MMPDERISVVMITHNRGTQIRVALEHLLDLPERPHLIVVDNGSTDGTADEARSLGSDVEVLALGHNLGCAGRNVGLRAAARPYVAFSDDDFWWQPGALSRAADLFDANRSLGLLAARILVGPERRLESFKPRHGNQPAARFAAK